LSASTHSPVLKHHFDNLEQQHSAERLGMWMFLATEVLFFSGLFVAYTAYRNWFPREFELASSHLIVWVAAVNTFLLITSSLTMTFAIRCAQLGDRAGLIRNLLITAALGTGFMGFKAYEYATDVHEKLVPGAMFKDSHLAHQIDELNAGKTAGDPGYLDPGRVQLFLCFYYIMTGIHGLHLVIGIGCVLWLVQQAYTFKIPRENYSTVEVVSLYWHLVDMIWLFLMPLLYLAGAGIRGGGH
jgi:cytochrome c oxidase subunit 3